MLGFLKVDDLSPSYMAGKKRNDLVQASAQVVVENPVDGRNAVFPVYFFALVVIPAAV